MTVSIVRSGGKPLVERMGRDAAGNLVRLRTKRRRSEDLMTLLVHVVQHAGVLPLFNSEPNDRQNTKERPRGYEVGFVLSLKDAGRAIRLEPELVQPTSKRKHFSAAQLQYLEGLILDLPRALLEALSRL